jgi:ankyrin repeat protein
MNIFQAIKDNNIEEVINYIESGKDINVENGARLTPLYKACETNNYDIAKLLLQHPNINVNAKNTVKQSILYISGLYENTLILALLLSHPEIQVNTYYQGSSLLHLLCQNFRLSEIELLLSHPNIDVNCRNTKGNTPLHIVCSQSFNSVPIYNSKNVSIAQLLLSHPKINVNLLNYQIESALYVACVYNNIKLIELLSNHPNIKVKLDFFIHKFIKNPEIHNLLKNVYNKYLDIKNQKLDLILNEIQE